MEIKYFNIDGRMYSKPSPICPSCGVELPKFPIRKTTCKACDSPCFSVKKPKEEIYYIVNDKTKELWSKDNTMLRKIDDLKWLGVTDNEIATHLNGHLNIADAYWGLLNLLLTKNARNFANQAHTYLLMANQLHTEDKNTDDVMTLYAECLLIDIEQKGSGIVLDVAIIASKYGECTNCSHLDGKILSLEQAKELKLLPHKYCNGKHCGATYSAIVRRDEDGFVVSKPRSQHTDDTKPSSGLLNRLLKFFK
jgi:hypothetical protein